MIISHRRKFAFFANHKTGSKAVGIMLRLSGLFDSRDIMAVQPMPATRTAHINFPGYNVDGIPELEVIHMTPQKAIDNGLITLEQLREYDCYAFIREPRERFLASRVAMHQDRNGNIAAKGRRIGGIAGPQYEFFLVGDEQVVTPLDFDRFDEELKDMLDSIGSYEHADMPAITFKRDYQNPSLYEFHPHQHVKDIHFYNDVMKNKYGDDWVDK